MPGGGGGSSPTMQTSNSNSQQTTSPNPYLAPQLQKIAGAAFDWTDRHMTPAPYFPAGTVAPMDPKTVSGVQNLFDRGIHGLHGLPDWAEKLSRDTMRGNYLNAESNPHFQSFLEASFRPQAEHFRDILAPSIDAKFSAAGRPGSGMHFDTTMRGVQDLERSQSDAAAKAALGLYQGERDKQFEAANLLPSLQAMDYQDLMAQLQAGGINDAWSQRALDDRNARYAYDTAGQLDWYNRLSQSLQGMYPGGTTTGQQSGSQWGTGGGGGSDQTGQLVGGGIAAAGTIAAAFI